MTRGDGAGATKDPKSPLFEVGWGVFGDQVPRAGGGCGKKMLDVPRLGWKASSPEQSITGQVVLPLRQESKNQL